MNSPITTPITSVAQASQAGAYDATNGTGAYARQTTPVPDPGASTNSGSTTPVLRYTGTNSTPAATTPAIDETALRTTELATVQGKIDTINSNFATNLQQTQQNNANITGSARATAARTGTLGSDFGNANINNANDKATAATLKVQQAHDNDLNTIYDGINKDIAAKEQAQATQQAKLTATQQKSLSTNAFKAVDGLASKGTPLNSLTQDEYNHLIESTGMNDAELQAYYSGKIPAEKTLTSKIQGNQFIQVVQDPTGATHVNTTPISGVPDNYVYNSSIQAFVPSGGIDSSKPVASQIIPFAKAASAKSAVSAKEEKPQAGYGTVKPSEITTLQGILNSGKGVDGQPVSNQQGTSFAGRGADGYVDPGLYSFIYQQFIANGGTNASFLKSFPVTNVNPSSITKLPAALQPKKSTSSAATSVRSL